MSDEDSNGYPDGFNPLLPRRVAILRAGESKHPLKNDRSERRELNSKYTILPSIVTEENFEEVERLVMAEFGEVPPRKPEPTEDTTNYEDLYNKMNAEWENMMRCQKEFDNIRNKASQQRNELQNNYRKYRRQTCAVPSRIPLPISRLVLKQKGALKPITATKSNKQIAQATLDSSFEIQRNKCSQFTRDRPFHTVTDDFRLNPNSVDTDTTGPQGNKPIKRIRLFDPARR